MSRRPGRRPAGFLQLVPVGPRGHAGAPGSEPVGGAWGTQHTVRPCYSLAAVPRLVPWLQPFRVWTSAQAGLQVPCVVSSRENLWLNEQGVWRISSPGSTAWLWRSCTAITSGWYWRAAPQPSPASSALPLGLPAHCCPTARSYRVFTQTLMPARTSLL